MATTDTCFRITFLIETIWLRDIFKSDWQSFTSKTKYFPNQLTFYKRYRRPVKAISKYRKYLRVDMRYYRTACGCLRLLPPNGNKLKTVKSHFGSFTPHASILYVRLGNRYIFTHTR